MHLLMVNVKCIASQVRIAGFCNYLKIENQEYKENIYESTDY